MSRFLGRRSSVFWVLGIRVQGLADERLVLGLVHVYAKGPSTAWFRV